MGYYVNSFSFLRPQTTTPAVARVSHSTVPPDSPSIASSSEANVSDSQRKSQSNALATKLLASFPNDLLLNEIKKMKEKIKQEKITSGDGLENLCNQISRQNIEKQEDCINQIIDCIHEINRNFLFSPDPTLTSSNEYAEVLTHLFNAVSSLAKDKQESIFTGSFYDLIFNHNIPESKREHFFQIIDNFSPEVCIETLYALLEKDLTKHNNIYIDIMIKKIREIDENSNINKEIMFEKLFKRAVFYGDKTNEIVACRKILKEINETLSKKERRTALCLLSEHVKYIKAEEKRDVVEKSNIFYLTEEEKYCNQFALGQLHPQQKCLDEILKMCEELEEIDRNAVINTLSMYALGIVDIKRTFKKLRVAVGEIKTVQDASNSENSTSKEESLFQFQELSDELKEKVIEKMTPQSRASLMRSNKEVKKLLKLFCREDKVIYMDYQDRKHDLSASELKNALNFIGKFASEPKIQERFIIEMSWALGFLFNKKENASEACKCFLNAIKLLPKTHQYQPLLKFVRGIASHNESYSINYSINVIQNSDFSEIVNNLSPEQNEEIFKCLPNVPDE